MERPSAPLADLAGAQAARRDRGGWLLGLILVLALAIRFYGIDWDQGDLFHPDERKIMQVVASIHLPAAGEWSSFFTTESPWNPHFFAYGSLPIYLLRLASDLSADIAGQSSGLPGYLLGRGMVALADTATVWLIYRLGRRLYSRKVGLLAAALLAGAVLHIQLAHFYTVDPLLTLLVVLAISLSVDLLARPTYGRAAALGVVMGLAVATKVSAAVLGAPVLAAWLGGLWLAAGPGGREVRATVWRAINGLLLMAVVTAVVFVVAEPYALLDPTQFWGDLATEGRMARGLSDIPYTRQYIGTLPFLYPLWQMAAWGLGLPLGLAGLAGLVLAVVRTKASRHGDPLQAMQRVLPLLWVALYFGIVGSFHAKFLRYMLPVTPFLCLWAGYGVLSIPKRAWRAATLVVVVGGTWFYALAFTNIYRHEHTWIQATRWLCENLPAGSRIMLTHWDDPLPMAQGTGELGCYREMEIFTFKAYDPDDTAKIDSLVQMLVASDYVVLPTNRLYGTLVRLPGRYPVSTRFYQALFDGDLGFQLVHYDRVRPSLLGVSWADDGFYTWPLATPPLLATGEDEGLVIRLGRPDESFTVYDHPMPLVFAKTRQLTAADYRAIVEFGVTP